MDLANHRDAVGRGTHKTLARSFDSTALRSGRQGESALELVRAVRAEDEFELEENRISFALGEEIVRL